MRARLLFAALFTLIFPMASYAATIVINPTSDGSLYTCDGCSTVSDGDYVVANGYIQGAVKFSSSEIIGSVANAMLAVNPYGLPIWDSTIDIYGYGTSTAELDVSDANAGAFLGTLTLPAELNFGQDAFFDVTSFVASTHVPYLAFNLRADAFGGVLFSSLEFNYGHASQLIVTAVPEPSMNPLLVTGLLSVGIACAIRRTSA